MLTGNAASLQQTTPTHKRSAVVPGRYGIEDSAESPILWAYYTAYPFTKIQWILAIFLPNFRIYSILSRLYKMFCFFSDTYFFVIHLNLQYV